MFIYIYIYVHIYIYIYLFIYLFIVENIRENWFVSVENISEINLCDGAHLLELLCGSRKLIEPIRTIGLCQNLIMSFCWLSIKPSI